MPLLARDERGQSSIEAVAVLPAVLIAGLVAWQLALAGHTLWLVGNAARVAARADVVGRDPREAAAGALPASLERDLRVERRDGDRAVRVSVALPLLVRSRRARVPLAATASLGGRR